MKIFRIDRQVGNWSETAAEALRSPEAAPLGVLPARLIADSAIVRNNRPVFLPDFARSGWIVEIRPAIHIGRLGKFIPVRFAERYILNVSLVSCLRQSDTSLPDPLADSFDGAITIGEPFPYIPDKSLEISVTFAPLSGDAAPIVKSANIPQDLLRLPETVALLSRYATLKSGDIILPASIGLTFPAAIGYSLTATLASTTALISRLK